MDNEALNKAIQLAGGQSGLAQKIKQILPESKVRQGHVRKWLHSLNDATTPPADWVLPICRAVEWRITPHQLRPDLYPNPDDALPSPQQALAEIDRREAERRESERRALDVPLAGFEPCEKAA